MAEFSRMPSFFECARVEIRILGFRRWLFDSAYFLAAIPA